MKRNLGFYRKRLPGLTGWTGLCFCNIFGCSGHVSSRGYTQSSKETFISVRSSTKVQQLQIKVNISQLLIVVPIHNIHVTNLAPRNYCNTVLGSREYQLTESFIMYQAMNEIRVVDLYLATHHVCVVKLRRIQLMVSKYVE